MQSALPEVKGTIATRICGECDFPTTRKWDVKWGMEQLFQGAGFSSCHALSSGSSSPALLLRDVLKPLLYIGA